MILNTNWPKPNKEARAGAQCWQLLDKHFRFTSRDIWKISRCSKLAYIYTTFSRVTPNDGLRTPGWKTLVYRHSDRGMDVQLPTEISNSSLPQSAWTDSVDVLTLLLQKRRGCCRSGLSSLGVKLNSHPVPGLGVGRIVYVCLQCVHRKWSVSARPVCVYSACIGSEVYLHGLCVYSVCTGSEVYLHGLCVCSVCTGSEESTSLGLPQDIRVIGQKAAQHNATNVSAVGGTKHCGPPEGNHTKILRSNSHICALIRIWTLDVKQQETIMEKKRFSGGRWQCKTVHCWHNEGITDDLGITNQYTSKNYQK